MSFRVKNNRNAQALHQTLQTLKPGNHGLKKNQNGSFVDVDACFEIESDDPMFCRFAGVRQGYFELPDESEQRDAGMTELERRRRDGQVPDGNGGWMDWDTGHR